MRNLTGGRSEDVNHAFGDDVLHHLGFRRVFFRYAFNESVRWIGGVRRFSRKRIVNKADCGCVRRFGSDGRFDLSDIDARETPIGLVLDAGELANFLNLGIDRGLKGFEPIDRRRTLSFARHEARTADLVAIDKAWLHVTQGVMRVGELVTSLRRTHANTSFSAAAP